ncbi:MAG TPA: type ISP restriction/modification enzyme [Pirellulaceae bacterium]|nr:type ISP restriction/modification enzyme [Pirellulaceae bacterium]
MPRQLDRGLSPRLLRQLASSLHAVRTELKVSDEIQHSLAADLQRDLSEGEAADALAQAIVCGSAIAIAFADDWRRCRTWLLEQSAPWEKFALERIGSTDDPRSSASFMDLTHLYEHLLRHDQPDRRKRAGVFYTPQPIVRYMLRQMDGQLREEFSLPQGLADEATWGDVRRQVPSATLPRGASDADPFIKLFDPAVGTGTFLLEAVEFIHTSLGEHWRSKGLADEEVSQRWNDYVPRQLLPRLWGMELLAAPCFLARLNMALKLAQTGYRFQSPARLEIHLGNTLAGPPLPLLASGGRQPPDGGGTIRGLTPPARQAAAYDVPFTVVLGNPPFSYLSENQSDWITSLVRGENGHAGYLQADGEKLGEKKTWLHDDYVKFIRYAQWRIETTGCGIVALVTNHGYLTNATFRIMRQQLRKTFPRVTVVDLHGNRKAREVAPDGSRDENVFGLDQGIAIGFFRRPPGDLAPRVEHAEIWGTRAAKFDKLVGPVCRAGPGTASGTDRSRSASGTYFVPAAPDFRFTPAAAEMFREYAAAPSLTELFPRHATAPVTARDHFVVAFTRAELHQRLEAFRDPSIPDDEIRRRYFTRTRSPRYAPGDTRGWKLTAARQVLAALGDWESFLQPCQYRPLDWRWIFWHPAMIDWPRHEVTSHFVSPKTKVQSPKSLNLSDFGPWTVDFGLALIARRQLPPSEPGSYFWATTALTLDGIIRNDNRGSESLFPVAIEMVDNACYAYALFHSPMYRQRYAATLRTGFPRVLPPRDAALTAVLTELGRQLIVLHTRRPPQFDFHDGGPASAEAGWSHRAVPAQRLLVTVAPRFPQYGSGRIWLREDYCLAAADEATWQFRVGAHQVARKWLADRRGRPLTDADLVWYAIILATIVQTRVLSVAIDAAIERHGGFPAAFLPQA